MLFERICSWPQRFSVLSKRVNRCRGPVVSQRTEYLGNVEIECRFVLPLQQYRPARDFENLKLPVVDDNTIIVPDRPAVNHGQRV